MYVYNIIGTKKIDLDPSFALLGTPKEKNPSLLECQVSMRLVCLCQVTKKRNNSCVYVQGDIYCLINKIVAVENTGYYIVARCLTPKPLILCNNPNHNVQFQHIKVFDLPRYVHVLSNNDYNDNFC